MDYIIAGCVCSHLGGWIWEAERLARYALALMERETKRYDINQNVSAHFV